MKGRYAVIEGLDFAGKSELAKAVAARLGWALVSEPYTGNEHAAEVKRMNNANYLPKHYEMMMILAGRIDCFDEVIDKHRVSGIISDRNVVSSMVYQSTERLSPHNVMTINAKALLLAGHDMYPDHIFFLDIPHSVFLDRLANCNRAIDEKDIWLKDEANWNALRQKYIDSLELMRRAGVTIHHIDEHTTADEIVYLLGELKLK